MTLAVLASITVDMARELALAQKVCIRPILRRVLDRDTGTEQTVAIACGSTRETVCPPCAHKARRLRMQQCAEGWHRTDEPDHRSGNRPQARSGPRSRTGDDQVRVVILIVGCGRPGAATTPPTCPGCRPRTAPSGRVFTAPDGREYRPSMFLTLTLPSYGPVTAPVRRSTRPATDYRRAALDALHFPKLVDRFWQNLRRCAGYKVQYFAAVEPQHRLAPHLHAAIRGAIPRDLLRQVIKATYVQIWWPPHDQPVYVHRIPVWDGTNYVDADTGEILPTWDQAVDQLAHDPDAKPAHVMRFGTQCDMRGIIAPSVEADRAVRYLTKYLTKAISDTHTDAPNPDLDRHVDRLHDRAPLAALRADLRELAPLRHPTRPRRPRPDPRPLRCESA